MPIDCPDQFDPDRALELAAEELEKARDDASSYRVTTATLQTNYGVALYLVERYDEARVELEAALAEERNPVGMLFLTMTQSQLGDQAAAEAMLRRVSQELDTSDPELSRLEQEARRLVSG